MTRIEELEQIINETAEKFNKEIDKFKAEIEHIKALAELKESKKEGKWLPKEGEEYWFRDRCGDMEFFHYDTDHEGDRWRIDNLPVFPTKEECARYWHFMDTVKEKSYEFSREEIANDNIRKFSICYIPSRNSFVVTHNVDCEYFGTVYFKAEEDAEYIINNFKEELLEYWL